MLTNKNTKEDLEEVLEDKENETDDETIEDDEESENDDESGSDDEETDDESDDDEIGDDEESETDDKKDNEEEIDKKSNHEDDDYKKKFQDSTRESMVLQSKNKVIEEKTKEGRKLTIDDITEEEMKAAEPDYESLSDAEKRSLKRTMLADKRWKLIDDAVSEWEKTDQWLDKVGEFAISEDNLKNFPELRGKEFEFKKFCNKQSRVGVDLEDLARAFSHDAIHNPDKKPNRKSLFPRGDGHASTEKKNKETDGLELRRMRKHGMRDYMDAIRNKRIKI